MASVTKAAMGPMLIEESSPEKIPHHLEVLVTSLDIPQESSSSSTDINDLIVVLLYVLMMEAGYSPLNVKESGAFHSDDGFSIRKLKSFVNMPMNWKNPQQNTYEMSFFLGVFSEYPCRLVVIASEDIVIVNLLVSNLGDEKQTYVVGIQSSKYVVNPTSAFIPSKFAKLKDLSLKFKNSIASPARSVILTKEGILNASLMGIPEEIRTKIFKNIKVSDFLNVSVACKDLNEAAKEERLWRYFVERDLNVNGAGVNQNVTWKEKYKRAYRNGKIKLQICKHRRQLWK